MYINIPFCNLWVREFVDNIFDAYDIPDEVRDLCFEKGKITPCKKYLGDYKYKKFCKATNIRKWFKEVV